MRPRTPWSGPALILLMLAASACSGKPRGPQEVALVGQWLGTITADGLERYAALIVSNEDGRLKGTMSMPFDNEADLEMIGLSADGRSVRFEVERGEGEWAFDGKIRTDGPVPRWEGTVSGGGERSPFRFAAVADLDPREYESLIGLYRFPDGRTISVAGFRGEMLCRYPAFLDFSDGRIRALIPADEDRYIAGPSFLVPLPVEAVVEPERDADGRVSGLRWSEGGRPAVLASRLPLLQEDARVENGDVTLAGTLSLPAGAGPHPAVVLTHGSGPQPRDHAVLRWVADHFVLNGVAVWAYDKRGVGGSTGSWNDASIGDLAADALAGLAYLKSRPEIDPERIGLWGISQGGWISVSAAARTPEVAFIVMVSGAGVGIVRQDVDRIELTLRTLDFPEAEVREAGAYQSLFYEAIAGRATWDELAAAMERTKEARWAGYVTRVSSRERFDLRAPVVWRFFSYDPAQDFGRVACPVLALFGGRDIIVPPDRNVGPMEEGFERGGKADLTIKVFPAGDHVLNETPTGAMRDTPFLQRLVPGYLDNVRDWLAAKLR